MSTNVLVEKKGNYAIVTLNRPEKRNALNRELLTNLQAAFEDVRADCSVVVLTGAGDRAFTAGMDLSEAQSAPGREFSQGSNQFFEVLEQMRRHPAVFIAAVNGFALGGGLTLTNNAELAIAAEHAVFGMPEISFGAFPALAGPATIHRVLPKQAAWMVLTGERVDAARAERWGLINEVVAADQLLPRAEKLAEYISAFDAAALDFSKKALRDIATMEWSRSIDYGLGLRDQIAAQSTAAEAGIANFVAGGRSAAQGSAEEEEK